MNDNDYPHGDPRLDTLRRVVEIDDLQQQVRIYKVALVILTVALVICAYFYGG